MKKDFENIICFVCEKQSVFFYAKKNGCDVHRCGECGLLLVSPLPGDLAKIYSEEYFTGGADASGYADYEGDEKAFAFTFKKYLKKIGKFSPGKGRLLDIGAATGHFLALAGADGWEASGMEISSYAAGIGQKKGLQIVAGNFEAHDSPKNHFDAVCFWDVLEHFEKPETAVRQARKILKTGGILAINTPDSRSLPARILGRRWYALDPPNHLRIFNRKNLTRLLEKNNFEIVETGRVGKKFSLRFILKVLSGWQKMKMWEKAYKRAAKSRWGKWQIPLNTRDNMFIIAKKQS